MTSARDVQPMHALPLVFPWMRFLPANEQAAFVDELIELTSSSKAVDSAYPLTQLITEWQHTAQVHADSELLKILRAPIVG